MNSMTFKKLFSSLFVFTLLSNIVLAEEDIKTEPKKESTNAFMRFIDKYVLPEKNPIFQDKRNEIYLSYHISADKGESEVYNVGSGAFEKYVHSFSAHYAQPYQFFRLNNRLSFGIYTFHGVAGGYEKTFKAYGVEIIQEFIFGVPMLYITAGVGLSYALGKVGQLADEGKYGVTRFNFPVVAKIGHRFDCGAILEILYKHYSNAGLGTITGELNMIGLSIGYVF